MPTSRCNFYVTDSETKRSRKCKHKKYINIKTEYCILHYKLIHIKSIILIQARFKGNKIRNKLNNIYNRLPDELQRLIINKGREYFSYNKYKKVINNIINKRICKIMFSNYTHQINNNLYQVNEDDIVTISYLSMDLYIQDVSHLCSLLNKYYCIYNEDKIINRNIDLYKLIRKIIYRYDTSYIDTDCELVKYYDLYSELRWI